MWVSPFRNLRINGYVLLPAAYRSLSRLSSALSAKASTLRSYSLYHFFHHFRDGAAFICIALHMRLAAFFISDVLSDQSSSFSL